MELSKAFLLCVAVLALLNFGILPTAKRLWSESPFGVKLKRVGLVAILEKVREVSIIAAIVYGALCVYVLFINAGSPDSLATLRKLLARTRSAAELLKTFKEFWNFGLFVVSFVVLGYLWLRWSKRHAAEKLSAVRMREYERLAKLRAEKPDEWKGLPPTAEMDRVWAALQQTLIELEEIPHDPSRETDRFHKTGQAKTLAELWTALDFDRRMEITWEADPITEGTRVGKLKRFLTSKGFLGDMKGVGKGLSFATSGLLALTLIGLGSVSASKAVEERALKLQDLRVEVALSDSEAELQAAEEKAEAKSQGHDQGQLTNEDRSAVHNVARIIAREMRAVDDQPRASENLRRELVIQEVRRRTSPNTAPETARATSESEKMRDAFADHVGNGGADPVVEQIEAELLKHAEENRGGIRQKLRAWAASHAQPASIDEMQDFFAEQITGAFLESVFKPPTSPLFAQGSKVVTEEIKKRSGKTLKTAVNRALVAMLRDVPPEQALREIRADNSLFTLLTEGEKDILKRAYPSMETQGKWAEELHTKRLQTLSNDAIEQAERVRQVIDSLPPGLTVNNEESVADLVGTFNGEFPLSGDDRSRESIFQVLNEKRKGIGEAPVGDNNKIDDRIARSTNYEKLRSYGRVGGILIGREPKDGSKSLNFSDIAWVVSNKQVSFSLRRSDGRDFQIGPIAAEIVHRALAYATDPRPVAVTMLGAELINRKQVLMHPALRDTALGARIAAADEWIFDYSEPAQASPSELRQSRDALYAETQLYAKAQDAITQHKESQAARLSLTRIRELMRDDHYDEAKAFEPHLLELAKRCRAEADESSFNKCVRQGAAGTDWSSRLPPVPRVAFVSQIFEPEYVPDPELSFIKGEANPDSTWPLKFTVQMTVNDTEHVTVPQFSENRESESTAIVLKGIRDHEQSASLKDLRDFTRIQRLFRVAFAGGLGPAFPLEKFIELADVTRSYRLECPTPRWLSEPVVAGRSIELEVGTLLSSLRQPESFEQRLDANVSERIRARIDHCAEMLKQGNAEQLSANEINKCLGSLDLGTAGLRCAMAVRSGADPDIVEACELRKAEFYIRYLSGVHELREALKAVDVPKNATGGDCSHPTATNANRQ